MAGQPRVRVRHRGGGRDQLADRLSATAIPTSRTRSAIPTPACMRSTRCCSRWSIAAAPGEGVLIEAAMVDAALNVAAEQVIEYSAYGALLQRDGNRGPTAAPQNLYRTNEIDEFGRRDCWVAVAVRHRRAVGRACATRWAGPTGRPTPRWRPPTAGAARTTCIDEHLSAWCAERTGDEIVDGAVGRRCAGGQGDAAAPADPSCRSSAARGFFEACRPSGERADPAQHPAVPVYPWARPSPYAIRAPAGTAQP